MLLLVDSFSFENMFPFLQANESSPKNLSNLTVFVTLTVIKMAPKKWKDRVSINTKFKGDVLL